MRTYLRYAALAALAAAPIVLSGCITTPTIADRVVEIVTTTSVSDTFTADGTDNITADIGSFDANGLDVAGILDDAGIDLSDVTRISLATVEYRVVRPDPRADRTVTGHIDVSVAGGASTPLVSGFTVAAGSTTPFRTPALQAGGVTAINNLLAQLLDHVKNGTGPLSNGTVSYTVNGASSPTGVATDFDYEIRITLNIQGTVKTKVLTGK